MHAYFLTFTVLALTIWVAHSYMIIVWGYPVQIKKCVRVAGKVNSNCVNSCVAQQFCVLSAFNGTCYLCMMNNVTQVTKTTSSKGWIVGFKVQYDKSLTQCPRIEKSPLFNNKSVSGDFSTYDYFGVSRRYTITPVASGWKISYIDKKRCPDQFYFSQRENVGWCSGLFLSGGVATDMNYARTECKKLSGAHVSGIGSKSELDLVVTQAEADMKNTKRTRMYVRIDGERISPCIKSPATCTKPEDYKRSDTYLKNFKFYKWVTGITAGASSGKQCIALVFGGGKNGATDFISCSKVSSPPSIGHVCGIKALA